LTRQTADIVYLGDLGNTQYIVMDRNFKKSKMHKKDKLHIADFKAKKLKKSENSLSAGPSTTLFYPKL